MITAQITTNKKGHALNQSTSPVPLPQEPKFEDPLTHLLRRSAGQFILQAVEEELELFLAQHASQAVDDGRHAVVRKGYLPKRTIQTGIGDVAIQVPKVRDRSSSGIRFNSSLLPPYLKKTRSIEELLPWIYLKGISTGQYQEALEALLGEQAKGLFANTTSRLKKLRNHMRMLQRRPTRVENYFRHPCIKYVA